MGSLRLCDSVGRRKGDPSLWCLSKERPLHSGKLRPEREGGRAGGERETVGDSQPLPNFYLFQGNTAEVLPSCP